MKFRCPNCLNAIEIADKVTALDETISEIACPSCQTSFSYSGTETESIGAEVDFQIAHFQVQKVLGEGAFGTVYRAFDTQLERAVAMKLPREGRISADTSQLFLKEAQAAAAIKHPNVVQVHEVGPHKDSIYIVSELIEGVSLSDWLRNRRLTAKEAARLMVPICDGVQAAHDANVIHRDLKPGNVLLDDQGIPYVTDFGLASRRTSTDVTVTYDGRVVGTPAYMSPEQARGDSVHVTALSDVYALGIIFYRMLTGRRPFEATDSRTMLFQILTDEPPAPRKIDKSIPIDAQTICLKAIEKFASNRYESAAALSEDLKRFLNDSPIHARPVSTAEKIYRWTRKNRLISVLAATVAILVACLFLLPAAKPDNRLHILAEATASSDVAADTPVRWAIVQMDPRRWTPIEESCQRRNAPLNSPIDLLLEPGDYLVIAEIENHGFHEVYRRVPQEPDQDSPTAEFHRNWTIQNETVVWPAIRVLKEVNVTDGMVAVPGGQFTTGDDTQSRPKHTRAVDAIWVSPTEVSLSDFLKTTRLVDPEAVSTSDVSLPATVSYPLALDWAEVRGVRLPTEFEFEYLGSALGTAEVPNGKTEDYQQQLWPYGPCGTPDWDQLTGFPIFGLHSNVAEWTDSQQFPYPGVKDLGPEADEFRKLKTNRVVKGGPLFLGRNDRQTNKPQIFTRLRDSLDMEQNDSEVGFRFVRSVRPRFVDRPIN